MWSDSSVNGFPSLQAGNDLRPGVRFEASTLIDRMTQVGCSEPKQDSPPPTAPMRSRGHSRHHLRCRRKAFQRRSVKVRNLPVCAFGTFGNEWPRRVRRGSGGSAPAESVDRELRLYRAAANFTQSYSVLDHPRSRESRTQISLVEDPEGGDRAAHFGFLEVTFEFSSFICQRLSRRATL
jgi:hypothetical protein